MDSDNNKSTRYAHSEGHVDICYEDEGNYLLTCGSDGDVRIWKGIDDDDPISHSAGDNLLAVAYKSKKYYSAGDDNAVRAYTFPDGQTDGMTVRFTAPVTHMVFNKAGSKLYAGASDFQIKVVAIGTADQKVITGHDAPILSLALHPDEKILASSSCDGTVRVWKLEDNTCVKTLAILPKGNDFTFSTTLCRMTWANKGKNLAVPVDKEIRMYNSESWTVDFTLTDPSIKEMVSVCAVSPCGNFIVAGCTDGSIILWDIKSKKVVNRDCSSKKAAICGLVWKPKGEPDLAYTDNQGNLGIIDEFIPTTLNMSTSEVLAADYNDIFGDDDDDMLMEAASEPKKTQNHIEDDDDDITEKDAMKSLFDDDDNSRGTVGTDFLGGGDDASTAAAPVEAPPPFIRAPPTTQLQPAFQSASTPSHLSHRFMLWNSVGIIRQYNTEEENSIDVEFHDTSTHHSMHITNTLGHSMAALSTEALLLACESDEDTPSQIVCSHFGAWDGSKEWSVAMPTGEEIEAITLGEGWAAVATDARQVRLLTVGGIQHDIFSLPGPPVALSGCGNQLLVIYHRGAGLPGDQCLGVQLVQVLGRRRKSVLNGSPLPLAHKATLAWVGFSAEGTPFFSDSTGALYMLNRQLGNTWTQVANTKSLCKGKSDHYWIVGIHENPAQIRAIMCKGAKYPPTLPRPNVNILPYQLPLCELSTDKGRLEETYWRSRLLSEHLNYWDTQGYEVDEGAKSRADVEQQETLIKMFALACKTEREARGLEIAELMSSQQAVQLIIKYASRLRKIQLAEKLTVVAREKAEEEETAGAEEQEEEEVAQPQMSVHKRQALRQKQQEEEEEEEEADVSKDIYEEMEEEEGEEEPVKPVLKLGQKADKHARSLSSQGQGRPNPFKVRSQSSLTPTSDRGTRVFDNMKPSQKSQSESSPEPTKKSKPRAKPLPSKKNIGLTAFTTKKSQAKKTETPQENEESGGKVTAFQAWLAENKAELEEEHPDITEAELTMTAAKRFKQLTPDEKKEWQEKASAESSTPKTAGGEKRKRSTDEEEEGKTKKTTKEGGARNIFAAKKKPLTNTTNSKLSAFSFSK